MSILLVFKKAFEEEEDVTIRISMYPDHSDEELVIDANTPYESITDMSAQKSDRWTPIY